MAMSEPSALRSPQTETRTARLVEDYHGNYGCIVRLSEAQLEALGVDIDSEVVEYAVVDGRFRVE
jgi:hypothetical protein